MISGNESSNDASCIAKMAAIPYVIKFKKKKKFWNQKAKMITLGRPLIFLQKGQICYQQKAKKVD